MLIRYVGPGGWSTVTKSGVLYRFNPECEITDEELIKMLRDDPGYEVVQTIKEENKEEPDTEKDEWQCPYCELKAKSKAGLIAHIRIKHGGKND